MELMLFKKDKLLKDYGRHYISEANIRVQVIEITSKKSK